MNFFSQKKKKKEMIFFIFFLFIYFMFLLFVITYRNDDYCNIEKQQRIVNDVVVNDEIDVVITWVDTNDKNWAKKYMQYYNEIKNKDGIIMRENGNEPNMIIKECIKGIQKNLPWIRNNTTTSKSSLFLDNVDKIKIVHHDEFFPEYFNQPVYSGMITTSHLHLIPGLSKYFIYIDDDVIIRKPMNKSDFFNEHTNKPIIYYNKNYIGPFNENIWNMILKTFIDHKKEYISICIRSFLFTKKKLNKNIYHVIHSNHIPQMIDKEIYKDIVDNMMTVNDWKTLHNIRSVKDFDFLSIIYISILYYKYYSLFEFRKMTEAHVDFLQDIISEKDCPITTNSKILCINGKYKYLGCSFN